MTTTNRKPNVDAGGAATSGSRRRTKNATTSLASERREHLVRLAAELFAQKGFQATTVREIADEAGILSGSLYHHFDSKESIVDEVLSNFLNELVTRYRAIVEEGGTPREVLARLVSTAFSTLETHRAAITVMQNDWNYLEQFQRFEYLTKSEDDIEEIWVGQIARGQRDGLFRKDIDAKLTYRMVRDTIWLAVRWFRPGGPLRTEDLAEHYIKVLFDGMCTHGGGTTAPTATS